MVLKLLVMFLVAGALCAVPHSLKAAEYGLRNDNTGCIADLQRARKNKGWLAIAVTRQIGIAQGCGIVSGAASRSVARSAAVQACKVNVKYEIFEGNTGCRLIGTEKRK